MIEAAKPKPVSSQTDQGSIEGSAQSRLDPITGDWTIFAPDRGKRPDDFKVTETVTSEPVACPFCRGHENDTPPPVWTGKVVDDRLEINKSGGTHSQSWNVRVVPNKFPAVTPADNLAPPNAFGAPQPSIFQSHPLAGGHEVIIESPEHVQSLTQLDVAETNLVFHAYRDRIRYWRDQPNIQSISVFKNVGGQAGASLQHSHSQLIALDRMPKSVAGTIERLQHHQATTGCCLQCDLIRAELKSKQRVITQTDDLIAFCPFASRLPMLIRVTSKAHQACFEDLESETIESVSRLVTRAVSWLESLHRGVSYNLLLHTRPPAAPGGNEPYQWSIDIFPRLTQIAGFEWSTDCMINPVLPETAAARYRTCVAAENPRHILRS